MTKSSFQWVDIYRQIDPYQFIGSEEVVNTQKMIEYIDRYGINAKDIHGRGIYITFYVMTNVQIDIVFDQYQFDPFIHGRYLFFYEYRTERGLHIFEKLIENDHDYKYLKCPINSSYFGLISLEEWFEFKGVSPFSSDDGIGKKMYKLYENHVKKGTSLFDLMLENIDLNIDKKQRIH